MIRCTLVCDGTSDRALIPIFEWSLWQLGVRVEFSSQLANFGALLQKPSGLDEKVALALELYPCDILFIHRDSENASPSERVAEISGATATQPLDSAQVAMIPVRMTEAWLLGDEQAIRTASGNPSGTVPLNMPSVARVESIADPKELLFQLIRDASELRGRRLAALDVEMTRTLVSQYINDFSYLRQVPSFIAFESELQSVIQEHHFDTWR